MTIAKLFTPIEVGRLQLAHRVVLAPLTRGRADVQRLHTALGVEYYAQRASMPGSLLITEATSIAAKAIGMPNTPGIWSDAQIAAWKPVVDAVHAKGSFIYVQLWATGRAAFPRVLESEGLEYVAPSAIRLTDFDAIPRALTITEIKEYVQDYATAAYNAVIKAGFDGVEIHAANGYLVDQFLQDVTNTRTDAYGGSIENRTRFALEVVDAIAAKIGPDRIGIRLSPWGRFHDMRMVDPIPQFSHLVTELATRHPSLAYVHVVEPRVHNMDDIEIPDGESNDFIRALWRPRPLISAGGYNRQIALDTAEQLGDLVAFGRLYISTPDLPLRLMRDLPIKKGERATYITGGPQAVGYTDYPFAE